VAEVVRKRERAESEQPRIEWSVSEHQVSAFLLGIGFQSVRSIEKLFTEVVWEYNSSTGCWDFDCWVNWVDG